MNTDACQSRDPDIIASKKALERAAREARKLSRKTGTPFYVLKDGKVVDLNRAEKRNKKQERQPRRA
jgi:hypothetical protein